MKLINKDTKKEVKKGDKINNNSGVEFKFIGFKPNGLIDVEGTDTDFHPTSFSSHYEAKRVKS